GGAAAGSRSSSLRRGEDRAHAPQVASIGDDAVRGEALLHGEVIEIVGDETAVTTDPDHVPLSAGGASPRGRSRRIVPGPSPRISTSIMARNVPVATRTPRTRRAPAYRSYSASARSG